MHEPNKIWDPGTIALYMRKGSTSCQTSPGARQDPVCGADHLECSPPTVPSTPPYSHIPLFFLPSLLFLLRHPRSTAQTHSGAKAATQQGQQQGRGNSTSTVAADQLGLQVQSQPYSSRSHTAVAAAQQQPQHSSRSHTAVATAQQQQPHSSSSRTAAAATQQSQPHSSHSHTAVATAQQQQPHSSSSRRTAAAAQQE